MKKFEKAFETSLNHFKERFFHFLRKKLKLCSLRFVTNPFNPILTGMAEIGIKIEEKNPLLLTSLPVTQKSQFFRQKLQLKVIVSFFEKLTRKLRQFC